MRARASAVTLLALDPGTTETAYVLLDQAGKPTEFAKAPNGAVATLLRLAGPRTVVIEMIASYGMPVGAEVFDTCVWIGRFAQLAEDAGGSVSFLKRLEVKSHLCHSARANDSTIRQALLDRYGPGREAAIGNKREPGPLYGVAGDVWAALAVACTAFDRAKVAAVRS